jgi:hypothetical protein
MKKKSVQADDKHGRLQNQGLETWVPIWALL